MILALTFVDVREAKEFLYAVANAHRDSPKWGPRGDRILIDIFGECKSGILMVFL